MSLPKEIRNLLNKHPGLVHTENCKVTSHVQREEDNWFVNTLMIADQNVPFLYKRKERYQSLTGARVNITYYPVE